VGCPPSQEQLLLLLHLRCMWRDRAFAGYPRKEGIGSLEVGWLLLSPCGELAFLIFGLGRLITTHPQICCPSCATASASGSTVLAYLIAQAHGAQAPAQRDQA